ncbi:hypothetical protein [Bacillus sp. ISL-37]|uniref:hypothetical protein n=1 Tax=Bacillus sp. ISL-37 TaxID=2819123 RepID=UPI001BE5E19C|nr:hypothetical protein [Bacillus sp. ISL-37]MBT2684884.1 hypothetical protein [Bacillus sp. ISL-37]
MKKFITIMIFILVTILLTSCNFSEEQSEGKKITFKNKKVLNDEITNYGFELGLTDETSINENQVLFKIKDTSSASFTPSIKIKNNFDNAYTYRLFFLIDYMHKSVNLNDRKLNYIDVDLNKHQSKEFSVSLDMPQGISDLLVLCVRDPDNILDEEQYVSSGNVYLARRAVIINGIDNYKKNINYSAINVYNQHSSSDNSVSSPVITLLNKEDKELKQYRISSKFTGNLQLKMGNLNNDTNYAILSFFGNEQMNLDNKYINVKGEGEFKIDLMSLPIKKALNKNIIISVVENPFTLDENELIQQKVEFVNIISLVE